ncbi:hypothetical protein [Streptomyces sp. NPDC127098]|uniref:hypothetical protein n=1 Tax=Streptomyces sp. NPDC127098 TaxID=3347137 RepID=UPI00365E6CBB
MFRRAFWFTTGAAAGVWATTKVQRTLRGLAPDSLAVRAADRAVTAGQRVRGFALDVRAGMAQRERELTEALGIERDEAAAPGRAAHPPQLPSPPHRAELGPVTRDTSRISEMRTTDGVG